MTKCAACGKFLAAIGAVSCSICPAMYHRGCIGFTETTSISKEWNCPECKKKTRKGDNSATPVRSVFGANARDIGPTSDAGTTHSGGEKVTGSIDIDTPVRDLRYELAECMKEIREFRGEMAELRSSIAGITERMDRLEMRLEAVERRRTSADGDAVVALERTVIQLKRELNDKDQEALSSDLEIGHLPEEKGENVVHTMSVLAVKLGVHLEERDIVFAERVGVPERGEGARARRIVVRLTRRHLCDELLRAARVRRGLTAADAGRTANTSERRIYVNERLTRTNRHLFYRAREESRKLQWRYSWTKRGRIFVRRTDGESAFQIRCEEDIPRVFSTSIVRDTVGV